MEHGGRDRAGPDHDYTAFLKANSGMSGGPDEHNRLEGATEAIMNQDDLHANTPGLQAHLLSIGRALPVVTPVVALMAAVASGVALWSAYTPSKLDALQARVASLQAEVSEGFDIKREVAALTSALEATQSHLAALDEAVARQMASPPQSRATQNLEARLDTLTAAVEELHARSTDTGPATAANSAPAASAPAAGKPDVGTWAVHLSAFSKENLAHAEVARLQALDIPAERHAFVDRKGRTWHRVFVRGFETRTAAENARNSFQTTAGVPKTWLERLPSAAGQARAGG